MKTQLVIVVRCGPEVIGYMTPDAFRKAAGAPSTTFLQTAVEHFNDWKELIGEPERVTVELAS